METPRRGCVFWRERERAFLRRVSKSSLLYAFRRRTALPSVLWKKKTGNRARERRERGRGAANGKARRRLGNSETREEKREKREKWETWTPRLRHRCIATHTAHWTSAPVTEVWLTVKLEQLQLYQI